LSEMIRSPCLYYTHISSYCSSCVNDARKIIVQLRHKLSRITCSPFCTNYFMYKTRRPSLQYIPLPSPTNA